MREHIKVSGVVVQSMKIGEYDSRIVILTRELGKIHAFVRGVRKVNNPLRAAAGPFVFGVFSLYEGKNSYTLFEAEVIHYFRELSDLLPEVYYGFYFLEFAAYFARENQAETDLINLIYVSLRALQNKGTDKELIRAVYELKVMALNGEYWLLPEEVSHPAAKRAISYVLTAPVSKIYNFQVKEEVLREVRKISLKYQKRIIDRPLKSLEILEMMLRP